MQNKLLREAVIPSHVPSQNQCDTICPGWSTGAPAMPRKAGEVHFISLGRDAKMTSTVPGRGSTVLQLGVEALSWNKGICSSCQNGFRVAAFTDPLQSPLLKQKKPLLSHSRSSLQHAAALPSCTLPGPSAQQGREGRQPKSSLGKQHCQHHPGSFGAGECARLAGLPQHVCPTCAG